MPLKSLGRKNLTLIVLFLILALVGGYSFFTFHSKKPVIVPLLPQQSLSKALVEYGNYEVREGNYDPKLNFIKQLGKLSVNDFPKKVTKVCETLENDVRQMCYSYSGARLFINNPSQPSASLPSCDKLPRSTSTGQNRTPANFCGSGLWGEFFNNINTQEILTQFKPSANQLLALCSSQNNFSNLTCYQEFGKYAMINKKTATDSELYAICNSIKENPLKDQCQSGAGRGIALKSSGNFLQLNVRCSSLTNDDFTVKCFNSLGMDSSKEYFSNDLLFCNSPLNSLGEICYYNYGKFAFGYNHGSITQTLSDCDQLAASNKKFQSWCRLGTVNSFLHADFLFKSYFGIYSTQSLCHDNSIMENALEPLCNSSFFMNYTIKNDFTSPDITSTYCKTDKLCYWSLGYSAKDEMVDLKIFCPTAYLKFCEAGYLRKLLL